jgi:cell division septum initiation protein DivIVA
MIDFEQLKIENQTLNEKIEERNEELAKLKRKKTVTVQVLTHVREKLRFIEKSNAVIRTELEDLENQTLNMRSVLTDTKRDRDRFKIENKELRRQQGFATSDLLLVDYESRKGMISAYFKVRLRDKP